MTRVTFVVPVKNDAARLTRCLESIARSAGGSAIVIVADNGSTDNTPDAARSKGARVLGLPDLRVSELRNRAAGEAATDAIAFVDADHEISEGWLTAAQMIL